MAFKTKLSCFLFMVALSFMVTKETHGCNAVSAACFNGRRAPMKIESRKLLAGFKIGVNGLNRTKNGDQDLLNSEPRLVPTGPDPLHHNRGSPKKPRTTP